MATLSYQGPLPLPSAVFTKSQPFPSAGFPVAPPRGAGTGTSVFAYDSVLPPGLVGLAYSQTLTASGGASPYSFAVTSGALPSGLTLSSSTGAITGTPSSAGSFSFTARVTDSGGGASSQPFSVAIGGPIILTASNSGYTA